MIAEPRLARSAGAAGIATLTSRILGVARDQVVLAMFGAGNDMDAFTVAFRIPNLVRDLFAEGAMSAAFVPTFTRHVTLEGKPAAWRLGNNVITALLIATGRPGGRSGLLLARPLASAFAGDYATVPGKLELTIHLTRVMLPFLTLAAVAAAMMGMLNSLHHYFVPALSPATFNVATIAAAVALPPVMIAAGLPAISSIAIGALAGGVTQILVQWRALRARGLPLPTGRRLARSRAAPDPRADGTGHDRPGGDAGQRVRQHAARHQRRNRRGVVAELRLPPDVSADRLVRRVDCDGGSAGGGAARGARRSPPAFAAPSRAGSD